MPGTIRRFQSEDKANNQSFINRLIQKLAYLNRQSMTLEATEVVRELLLFEVAGKTR
jgi:hypothetical protein